MQKQRTSRCFFFFKNKQLFSYNCLYSRGAGIIPAPSAVPLDSGARPTLGEPSRGRIYADVNGFLDPVDFRGQLVTVVGPITGAVDGKIGNTPYKFMVMQVTGYKRWHLTQQVIMPPQPIDPWFYGGRGWPYGYGGWGWYNPGPARVQTVVTE